MLPRPFLFILLSIAGCASEPAPIAANPAMWRVADADTEIILMGTIHLLPDAVAWQGGGVAQAVKRADTLVLEVADIADAQGHAARFLAVGRAEGLAPVMQRVRPDARGELARIAGETGPTLSTLDRMKSWAAAVALGGGLLRDVGAKRENGVDTVLAGIFARAGKPVIGLETADAQFAAFDGLAETDQRVLLERVIADGRDPKARFAAMRDAWATGDSDAIAASFDATMRASPALADALVDRRNAAWADWIARRLKTPGTVLVAIGAGHLAGGGSVQDRLAAQGLTVTRVQ